LPLYSGLQCPAAYIFRLL